MVTVLALTLVFLVVSSCNLTPLQDNRRRIIEQVRNHLRQSDATPRVHTTAAQLENSNKIGLGYNLLAGSPVCFTGKCQTDGFTRPIFKLNYTSPVLGSCTNKLVPNYVHLDCVPGGVMNMNSEIIDTVEHLHKSISNKVEMSIGVQYKNVGFSYSFSTETQYMLDTIVKKHQTSILTEVEIGYARLSLFEPKMELSDNFKYVIDNMPCCEEDADSIMEEYVKEFIFDYFGFTYVTKILLGGTAQQNILIDREVKERLESNGVVIKVQAGLAFGAPNFGGQIGSSVTNTQMNAKNNSLMKEAQSHRKYTLGGAVGLNSLEEWSKTVPSNPIIVEFAIKDIFRLLTKRYFPVDALITNKSKLIEKILDKYIAASPYCYNDCGGNGTRGTCERTGYFQFGICKCKSGWTGPDCQTVEPQSTLHGTICGFDRSFMQINCGGIRPWHGCPQGWTQYNWPTDLTVCYKDQTKIGNPVHGTLCGLHSYQLGPYPFLSDIGCGTAYNVLTDRCPSGYRLYSQQTEYKWGGGSGGNGQYGHQNGVCVVMDAKEHSPGTLCGMQVENSVSGPSCDGFNPGLRQCPPNYFLHRTAFNDLGFMVCVMK